MDDLFIAHEPHQTVVLYAPGKHRRTTGRHFKSKRIGENYWRSTLKQFTNDDAQIAKLRKLFYVTVPGDDIRKLRNAAVVEKIVSAAADGRIEAHVLSDISKKFLDNYYRPVVDQSSRYDVDPTLVLGLASESGFGATGTYLRTRDVFGLTNGGTTNMTIASSPDDDVTKFFDLYGEQIRGVKDDVGLFLNRLRGLDAGGKPVKGEKNFNPANPNWYEARLSGIRQMQADVPLYELVTGRQHY